MEELKPMSDSEAICVLEKAVAQGGTFGFVEKFKIAANNAIEALNRRAAPENKTLTLDQLRQMDGEPVWVVYPTDLSANHWEIIYLVVQQYGANGEPIGDEWVRFTSGASERAADYGKTWLAYARRPEVVP